MPTVFFDDVAYEVAPGRNLLEAALDHHLDLPYFCWHPGMGSVGACRQCALRVFKDADDEVGKIVMGCMTPAADGTRASLQDPVAVAFRRSVIEWLMVNHPHDCPVCDEGGECHLQDMTAMTGHVYRRYRGLKRTYRNQDLGPFVTHEMNRCIQCYRCLRFYRDTAGGSDFNVFGSRNRVYFGRVADGVLESEFTGNLAEVCPTGVFTDKTLARHYTRKWDLATAPSVCPHCAVGCNVIPGARYGELRRVQNRYHPDINGYFICDRGRFGYEFTTQPVRLRGGAVRGRGVVSGEEGLVEAARRLREAHGVVGVGSGRASLEANFLLRRLVGEERFATGLPGALDAAVTAAASALRDGPARTPTVREVEEADAVLLLAVDPTSEAPRLDLALRRAVEGAMRARAAELNIPLWNDAAVRNAGQGRKRPLFVVGPAPIKLEGIATGVVHAAPDEVLRLAAAIAGRGAAEPAAGIAAALFAARRPLVVVSAAAGAETVRAGARIARALCDAGAAALLSVALPEANSLGVALLGGRPLEEALAFVERGAADTLVVLANDLGRWLPATRLASLASKLQSLIVLDCLDTATVRTADVALPAAAFGEENGTFVSQEGRAQRFYQVHAPPGEAAESWSLLAHLGRGRERSAVAWGSVEEVAHAMAEQVPALARVPEAAPPASFRVAGAMKIAREPHRASGRTAVHSDRSVFDPGVTPDPQTPFTFSMEGYQGEPPAALVPRFWRPGWNSQQSVTFYQESVNGPLAGGPAGVRLLEPGPGSPPPDPGALAAPRDGEVWVVPTAHIFGSDELSRHAPSIAAVTPPAALAIGPDDAAALGVADGQGVELTVEGEVRRLPARLDARVPRGVTLAPAGYPETQGLTVPRPAVVRRA
ncbi:MAG TPA: NADH-quinone oxidoreductase subunit NuoG [Polyangia bacterium]|jgi:NADH-quinone oxidoreductase subunit G